MSSQMQKKIKRDGQYLSELDASITLLRVAKYKKEISELQKYVVLHC